MARDAAPRGETGGDTDRRAEEGWVRLRELQHRARNDLQLLSALAQRHGRGAADPAAKRGFDAIARHAILLARLYGDLLSAPREGGGTADLAAHLSRLCATITDTKDLSGLGIDLVAEVQPVQRDPEAVNALGLAVNELISNAVGHAFPEGRRGRITVQLTTAGPPGEGSGEDEAVTLLVADDGEGFAGGDLAPDDSGLGIGLARWLVRRAGGTLTREAAHGTVWRISLP